MKRMISIVILLCLILTLPVRAEATFQNVQYVVDGADILTDEENIELNDLAQSISDRYGIDVLIATVDSLQGQAAWQYAADLYSGSWWDSENAILFLLAMEEREWYISTCGEAITAFTDYSLAKLEDKVIPSLSDGDYYGGFAIYLNALPDILEAYEDGTPLDGYYYNSATGISSAQRQKTIWSVLPLSLLIGIAAAAVVVLIMRGTMNTKRKQSGAADYLNRDSYHLRVHQDMFLYSNVTKTRRQQSSGSGGGSNTRSSGGRSHGGRGGSF